MRTEAGWNLVVADRIDMGMALHKFKDDEEIKDVEILSALGIELPNRVQVIFMGIKGAEKDYWYLYREVSALAPTQDKLSLLEQ